MKASLLRTPCNDCLLRSYITVFVAQHTQGACQLGDRATSMLDMPKLQPIACI